MLPSNTISFRLGGWGLLGRIKLDNGPHVLCNGVDVYRYTYNKKYTVGGIAQFRQLPKARVRLRMMATKSPKRSVPSFLMYLHTEYT